MTWINKLSKTIQYGEHEIVLTVRGETGMDSFIERGLFRRIYQAVTGKEYGVDANFWSAEVQAINTLVEMINRTESVDGLPDTWATIDSDDKALKCAYDLLAKLPGSIVKEWRNLLDQADAAPGDPDTAPPHKLTVSQKKADKSKQNATNLETT